MQQLEQAMAVDQTDAEAAAAVCVADSQISAVSQHGDRRGTLDRLNALIVCIRLESAEAHSQATTLSPATPSEIAHAARLILQAMDAQRQETTTSQAADEGAVRGSQADVGCAVADPRVLQQAATSSGCRVRMSAMLPGTPKIDITDGHNNAILPTQAFETAKDMEFNAAALYTKRSSECIDGQWYKNYTNYSVKIESDGSRNVIEVWREKIEPAAAPRPTPSGTTSSMSGRSCSLKQ
jgi:hypothetical protein